MSKSSEEHRQWAQRHCEPDLMQEGREQIELMDELFCMEYEQGLLDMKGNRTHTKQEEGGQ